MREQKYHYYFALLVGIPLFLYIDSPFFQHYFSYAQNIATLLVVIAFILLYKRVHSRYKEMMLIGIGIGFLGEFMLSKGLGLYHYRLDNIPLWVGFGHSLIFASVHTLKRIAHLRNNTLLVQKVLFTFVIFYSGAWLYFANDWFGFISTIFFVLLLFKAKKSRLFFLIMFFIVAYIEIVGTTTLTWFWPHTIMNIPNFIPSANPPSGIALFYFIFDFLVLRLYFFLHPKSKQKYFQKNLR